MMKTVGILAYGSVISDPREEIEKATIRRMEGVKTPFSVEFARSSSKRSGAPTLVPVENGGSPVNACVFVVDLPEAEAANCLYRREINTVGSGQAYKRPSKEGPNTVFIERVEEFAGLDVVLYARIPANIEDRSAQMLAALAVESARRHGNGRDGISYLIAAKASGVATPLSGAYEEEIKRAMNVATLEEALAKARGQGKAGA